jgi:hypothetical protein
MEIVCPFYPLNKSCVCKANNFGENELLPGTIFSYQPNPTTMKQNHF